MNTLKIRVELNKGQVGIPLGKLGRIAQETLQFLSAVGKDIGIEGDPEDWIALNFDNNSVDFDCEHVGELEPRFIDHGNRIFRTVMGNDLSDMESNLQISTATRIQYARIANPIDQNEKVSFGLYGNGQDVPSERFELTKELARVIDEATPQTVAYHGEIQGIVHAFYKESRHPKLVVRELSTKDLVDCFFEPNMYQAAVETLLERDAVVFIEGEVTEDRTKGQIEYIKVEDFRPAPVFDEELTKRFIGSQPNYTGELTTEAFIEEARADG